MNTIQFTKMHGLGNDYIYVDTDRFPILNPEELAIRWSRYHTGIGSDGLVLISRSDVADFRMRIFNADGSEAMMCGNASRCIGKYVYERGLTRKTQLTLETLSGIKHIYLKVRDQKVESVTVNMGGYAAHYIEVMDYIATEVNVGNPHCVIFVDDVAGVDVATEGRMIENDSQFPDRTNVEFAELRDDGSIRMRVWERGSGITQACGTGACATAVAAYVRGLISSRTCIVMDGGTLDILINEDDGCIYMTGSAEFVFDGEITV